MKTVKVNLKDNSYNILIGHNVSGNIGEKIAKLNIGRDAYIITNPLIKNKYCYLLTKTLKKSGFTTKIGLIPDTEKSKSLKTASVLLEDIAKYDPKREIFIIAFGGGVVGDLAGFIASIYKRGIPYVQIPTTLLAQVDSGIGGKTAVDLTQGKNLVGTFYQPKMVFSEIRFLESLNRKQIRNGLAEVIKYAIINDSNLFSLIKTRYHDILKLEPSIMELIITKCSRIKADIVEKDEREEKGLRTLLNFGHTIGHAIEAAGNFRLYNHGEAIAIGMLVAAQISVKLNLTGIQTLKSIEDMIEKVELPTGIPRNLIGKIIHAHYYDKKFSGERNRLVLIEGIGRAKVVTGVPLKIIKESILKRTFLN